MGTRGLWLFWLVAGCFGSASVATPPAVGIIASVAEQSAPLSARLAAPTRLQRSGDAFVVVAGSTALATSLPATADGTWRLTHGRYVAMDAVLEGALPVAGQLVDGAVVYASIHTSTDAVVRANEDQVELFYVLHDDTAPRSWRWATSPGDGTWRPCDSGAELVDDTGHVRLHATRPIAFDSDGTLLAMSMRVEADVLSYELVGASQIDWPVVVDPGFDIAYWEQRHDAFPLPLAGPAFVYDDARAETLLYGGASPDYDDETWTWDGERWERHRPPTRPPPLVGASAVFDPERGVVWMFGGFDGREARGELWRWDGEDWTSVVREPSPRPMALSAMAFDPVTRTVLLFGGPGVLGTEWLGETWRWDGASWSMLAPPTPEPRCAVACSMVFEPGGRALLVSTGGAYGTWGWDGAAWSRVDAAGTPLFAPQRLVVDELGVLALSTLHPYGPSRARWEGSNWVPIEDPSTFSDSRPMPSGAYDRLRRRPILYGGRNTAHNLMGDLMEHDGARWRLVSPTATFRRSVPAGVAPGVLPDDGAPRCCGMVSARFVGRATTSH